MEFTHFLTAQDPLYPQVLRELTQGQKQSHWMWFIFPQIHGLGFSEMSQRYALDSLDAAQRYLQHPLLGERLRQCTQLVLNVQNRSAEDIFGYPDYLKFQSSLTLFSLCTPADDVFHQALNKYYAGKKDPKTLALLGLKTNPNKPEDPA